jgi:hypothetical protein
MRDWHGRRHFLYNLRLIFPLTQSRQRVFNYINRLLGNTASGSRRLRFRLLHNLNRLLGNYEVALGNNLSLVLPFTESRTRLLYHLSELVGF